jgi:hypothetical protein
MVTEIFEETGIPRLVDQVPEELDQLALLHGRSAIWSIRDILKDNQTQILDISTSGEKR